MVRNDNRVWYEVGDVLEVVLWDHERDGHIRGIVEICGWYRHDNTRYGIYQIRSLEGSIDWIYAEVTLLQDNVKAYIGNMEDNKTLKVLYGKAD